jgi:hypothetical protein
MEYLDRSEAIRRDGLTAPGAREVDMFRHQLHAQVRIGQYRDYYTLYEKLDQILRAKKLVPAQLWAVSLGPLNSAVLVTDYESIEAYDRNLKAFVNDPDVMSVWREMGKHVDGIPWDELWESAFQIA